MAFLLMSTLPLGATEYEGAQSFRQLPLPGAAARKVADTNTGSAGSARIVGGTVANPQNWPSFARVQALVGNGRALYCGGAVIARQWVMTAAHCVRGQSAEAMRIFEGRADIGNGGDALRVDRIVSHPNYFVDANDAQHYDVALLHLTSYAQSPPQRLVSYQRMLAAVAPGAMAEAAGYGLTLPQGAGRPQVGSASTQLREVALPIYDHAACGARMAEAIHGDGRELIDDTEICAGDPVHYGADSCAGDSGGPLAMNIDGVRTQIGIVSWGAGCAQPGSVGVYSSVGYFQDWIRGYVADADFGAGASVPVRKDEPQAKACGVPDGSSAANMSLAILEGSRLPIGASMHFRAAPAVGGQLVVINVDLTTCRSVQIYPNRFTNMVGGNSVRAGQDLLEPNAADQFQIQVSPPSGPNRLFALIIPDGVAIQDLAGPARGLMGSGDARMLLRSLSDRAVSSQAPIAALGVFDYVITP